MFRSASCSGRADGMAKHFIYMGVVQILDGLAAGLFQADLLPVD